MIDDTVFGKIEFEYAWFKYTQINFFQTKAEIVILISGDEDGVFEEGQYEAFESLIENWDNIHESFLEPILNYYKNKRSELGYDVDYNETYPQIDSAEEILNYITLVGIKVPYSEVYGGRSIGVSFDCTWDEENGLGLRLSDEQVIEVGFQDVAI